MSNTDNYGFGAVNNGKKVDKAKDNHTGLSQTGDDLGAEKEDDRAGANNDTVRRSSISNAIDIISDASADSYFLVGTFNGHTNSPEDYHWADGEPCPNHGCSLISSASYNDLHTNMIHRILEAFVEQGLSDKPFNYATFHDQRDPGLHYAIVGPLCQEEKSVLRNLIAEPAFHGKAKFLQCLHSNAPVA